MPAGPAWNALVLQPVAVELERFIGDEAVGVEDEFIGDVHAGEIEGEAAMLGGESRSVHAELTSNARTGEPNDSSAAMAGGVEAVVDEDVAVDVHTVGVECWAEVVGQSGGAELEVPGNGHVDDAEGGVLAVAVGVAVVDPQVAVNASVVGVDGRPSGVGDRRSGEGEPAADVRGEQPDRAVGAGGAGVEVLVEEHGAGGVDTVGVERWAGAVGE